MAPKEKTKRTLTPEQLEKLAVARAKANEVRTAMKQGREDAQVAALQAKMDVLKSKKKQKDPEPITDNDNDNDNDKETPEPTSVPVPDEETDKSNEDKVAKVEPVVEPQCKVEPKTEAGPPVEKLKKKTKKKVIIMPNSDSDSDSDDSNVIFVKRSSRKKKETLPPQQPPPTPQLQKYEIQRPLTNPFFHFNSGIAQRNFM